MTEIKEKDRIMQKKVLSRIYMNIVFLNGEFIEKKDAKISIFDHGFLYADALYETLLIYKGNICFFDEHWNRLSQSIQKLQMKLPSYFSSAQKAKKIIEQCREKNKCTSGRLRITFSRGENNFNFVTCPNPTITISISPLTEYPKDIYTQGVSTKKIFYQRVLPQLKTTNSIASVLGRQEISMSGDFEGIFCSTQDFLREGTVSNILAVVGKEFWSAPKDLVLPGTMQGLVEKILKKNGYTKKEKNFCISDITEKKGELYLLNSLFGVVPVQSVDEEIISKKFPVFEKHLGIDFFEKFL